MYTTACKDDTEYSISNIRRQLQNYELKLENDKKLFQDKLNRTRSKLFEEIHRLINELNDIKEEYTLEFDYLEHENLQTCDGNQRRFKDLCCLINEYEHDEEKIYRHFKEFQETFPMRPKMISNIPDIYVEDIHMKSLIKPNHFSRSTADYTPQILTENKLVESIIVYENYFSIMTKENFFRF